MVLYCAWVHHGCRTTSQVSRHAVRWSKTRQMNNRLDGIRYRLPLGSEISDISRSLSSHCKLNWTPTTHHLFGHEGAIVCDNLGTIDGVECIFDRHLVRTCAMPVKSCSHPTLGQGLLRNTVLTSLRNIWPRRDVQIRKASLGQLCLPMGSLWHVISCKVGSWS